MVTILGILASLVAVRLMDRPGEARITKAELEIQSLENALKNLGETLDKTGNVDLQDEDQFIKISTGIKTGRALRLLQCFDIAHPGAAAKLLMHAEENIEAQNTNNEMFLQRNIVFERLRLFSRIFS